MLLWHGSRLTNWCGILSQGLRIAPPEAPVTGYMVSFCISFLFFRGWFSRNTFYVIHSNTHALTFAGDRIKISEFFNAELSMPQQSQIL